ncbi:MAG TPA: hypothetical protein VKS81_00040, partial [Bacteroidota bacterium]|nr:hypothetical protein [Bacteroidota bacterium]
DTTTATFQIQDASGNPLQLAGVPVSLLPSGLQGSFTTPTALTNALGLAYGVFQTGTDTGHAVIQGQVANVQSDQQSITVLPGKASSSYFTMVVSRPPDSTQKYNFPGPAFAQQKVGSMRVTVLDRYRNPVAPGTVVALGTAAGSLQTDTVYTDQNGNANVDWLGGGVSAANVKLTASVIGELNRRLNDSVVVTYSGAPVITLGPELGSGFLLQHGVDTSFSFTVKDVAGNPMAQGETLNVVLGGPAANEVVMSGNSHIILPDTRSATYTTFKVQISDTNKIQFTPQELSITIQTSGPNGSAQSASLKGNLNGVPPPPFKVLALDASSDRISVFGVGGTQTVTLTAQLRDTLGNNVNQVGVDVLFSLVGVSGNLTAQHVSTNANGTAVSTFIAGTLADTVSISAHAGAVSSVSRSVFVLSGPPNQSFFRLALNGTDGKPKVNFPGMATSGEIGTAIVVLKDKYGNVCQPFTPVIFTSNAGTLIPPTGYSDPNGQIQIAWFGGAPNPAGGTAYVTATADTNGRPIAHDSVAVLYTGAPVITTAFPAVFRHGIDTVINYTVADANHNPLSQGSTISVSASGPGAPFLALSGNLSTVTADTKDPTTTHYSIHIRDTNSTVSDLQAVTFSITVNGGNGSQSFSSSGTLLGAPAAAVNGLALVGNPPLSLTVQGAGGTETSLLTFELRDSLGNRIHRDSVVVNFTSFGVPGRFTPPSAMTDSSGRVQTVFHDSTIAGIVRIAAQVAGGGVSAANIKLVVVGGKPSPTHFTFEMTGSNSSISTVNFPGEVATLQTIGSAQVEVADKYSNPVPAGTPIYFTTNAGVITGSAVTDGNGLAKVSWSSGKPFPAGGIASVIASANGDNGVTFYDTLTLVYSGPALAPSILGVTSGFVYHTGIDTTFTYRVVDANGNPLAAGATFDVTASGTAASSLVLTGDVHIVMPDTASAKTYTVHVRDTNSVFTTTRSVTLNVAVSGGQNGTANAQVTGSLQGVSIGSTHYATIASLALATSNLPQLTVKNSGGTQMVLLTYQLRDSLNNPVTEPGIKVWLKSLNSFDNSFLPDTATTDVNGNASAQFLSDSVAGIAQFQALVIGSSAVSPVSKIVVVGGKPAQSYFTFNMLRPGLTGSMTNFPGNISNVSTIGTAQVQMGDQFGNPVPAGTPVTFTTNAGLIQGSATTDGSGLATATWTSGNPIPAGETAIVTASAVGNNGATVSKTLTLTYSGATVLSGGPASSFQISGDGSMSFNYKVADALNQPIAEGSTITVTATGAGASTLVLSGNLNVTTPDTRDTAKTNYTVTARDTSTTSTNVRSVTFTIAVNGANGTATQSFTGNLEPIGHTASRTRLPGSIALVSNSATDLQVQGTGGTETATLVFEIKDSVGVAVDSSYQVSFSINNAPGGSFISPNSGLSDSSTGQIDAVVHSGTVSGVVQIVANVTTPTGTISSTPVLITVHSGLPDSTHFTVARAASNFPGLDLLNQTDVISVIVGDKYSNPVATNTAVYFSTKAGLISPSGYTNANGDASATLFSANPLPVGSDSDLVHGPGFTWAYARTDGDSGKVILDSVLVLFSGTPITTYGDSSVFNMAYGGTKTFSVTVADRFGNPIAPNSTIALTYQSSATTAVTTSNAITMPDTQDRGPGLTQFRFSFSVADWNTSSSSTYPGTASATITLTVTWQGQQYVTQLASGTIH